MKRCLTFLVMREMQIKATMRARFPSTRVAKMKKIESSKYSENEEKLGPHTLLTGMGNGAAAVEHRQFLRSVRSYQVIQQLQNTHPRVLKTYAYTKTYL